MKKNVAGQMIGAQMVSATNGAAFTGSVTVSVTGDAGTQATGSVGAGACTHEGNGYHTYAPAQAETNYDLIAFTFVGTGAIPQTVQVLTTFPQTGDSFARIGTAGAGLTNIDLPNQTMDITGNLSGSVGSVTAGVTLAASAIQAIWDALTSALTTVGSIGKLVVDNLNATIGSRSSHSAADVWASGTRILTAGTNIVLAKGTGVTGFNDLSAAQVNAEADTALADVGVTTTVTGRIDATVTTRASQTSVDDLPTNAELATALGTADDAVLAQVALVKAKTDLIPASPAAVADIAAALDATIPDSVPADGTRPSIKQALYMLAQFMFERSVTSTTVTVNKPDGTTSLMTFTINSPTAPTSITRAT